MIENGTKTANLETIWKIANALQLKSSELIHEIELTIENKYKEKLD